MNSIDFMIHVRDLGDSNICGYIWPAGYHASWQAFWTGSFKLKGVFSRCCVHGRMCPQKKIPAHFTMDIALSQFAGTFLARTQA